MTVEHEVATLDLGIGDHFTTLDIYVEDRKKGRALAAAWRGYIQKNAPEFWGEVRRKAAILGLANRLGLSLSAYLRLKKFLVKE